MLKYDFKNNNAVVDQPSIWKIGDGKITITTASGTDAGNIPSNGVFTIQVGNVDPIRAGGTEHYGYDKNIIEVGYTSGSQSIGDRLLVDYSSVTLCQYAGENSWCRCEKIPNVSRLVYTALEENPTDEPRYAYFKHKTISNFTSDGDPVLSEWWVTVMQEANPDPKPQSQNENTNTEPSESTDTPTTPDNPSESGTTIFLNLNNTSNSDVTIEGTLRFVLANPDKNGEYHGWNGLYNRTDHIKFSNSQITIGRGQSRVITIVSDQIDGRSPASREAAASGGYSSNVLLYVGDNSSIVKCDMMATNYVFQNGGSYNINIISNSSSQSGTSGSGSETTPSSGSEVYTNVTIVNNSGFTKTFDGRVCFITYGSYDGYTGYFRIKGTCSGSDFTIANGSSKTYKITFAKDNNQTPSVAIGMRFATQAQRGQFQSNNGYYVNGSCYTCNDFNYNDTFRAGGSYTMTIPTNTHEWSSTSSSNNSSSSTPNTTNQPTTGSVTTTVTIVNNTGAAKTFTGRVCFITYGTYDSYTGYFRIKGNCSGADLTIPAGGSKTYTVTFPKDNNQTPSVAIGMNFASQVQRNQFKSNNGYYMADGGCYTCNDFSTSDTFRNGGQYTMVIPANTHEWSS